mmetsp:Transcript_47956/g.97620  ORF Transcript_47956/g.97620 Transcript_47956/m.97620 type:complete len:94 (-) Transcript_47956:286-567(-)
MRAFSSEICHRRCFSLSLMVKIIKETVYVLAFPVMSISSAGRKAITNVTLSGQVIAEMLTSTSTDPGELAVRSVEQLALAAHEFAEIATLMRV